MDSIARMPAPPPRLNTLRERATKYREASGSLTWERRDGSDGIRSYILSLLPTGATSTRPLGRDLTKEQLAIRKAINAGKAPNRRRKTKREAEAEQLKKRENADRVAAGRVSKEKPRRESRKKKPSTVGFDPDDRVDEEAAEDVKAEDGDDEDHITTQEQVRFDALVEASRQRRLTAQATIADTNSARAQQPVDPHTETVRNLGSRQHRPEPAVAGDRTHSRRRNDQVTSAQGVNFQGSSALSRRKAREPTPEDEEGHSASQPRRRKRARNEASASKEEDSESDIPLSKRQKRGESSQSAENDDELDTTRPQSYQNSQGSTTESENWSPNDHRQEHTLGGARSSQTLQRMNQITVLWPANTQKPRVVLSEEQRPRGQRDISSRTLANMQLHPAGKG